MGTIAATMPYRPTFTALVLAGLLSGLPAQAQHQPSQLDAPLFYDLLLAEMELQQGDVSTAFQRLLDAARRTGDEELFRRVVTVAMQARAGSEAYMAARAPGGSGSAAWRRSSMWCALPWPWVGWPRYPSR